jgi:hypothetical protein
MINEKWQIEIANRLEAGSLSKVGIIKYSAQQTATS